MLRMRCVWLLAALALVCAAGPAAAQLPALKDRPLNAEERVRLTSLEAQFVRISTQRNTSVAALRAIARAMGDRLLSQDPDQIIKAVDQRAQDLAKARDRIGALERDLEATDSMKLAAAVNPMLTQARAAIDEGRLEEAENLLQQAGDRFAQARGGLQARLADLSVGEADIDAQRAGVRSALFDDQGAAELYAKAADLVPLARGELRVRYRMEQAAALMRRADLFVDNEAAVRAASVYRDQVLPFTSRDATPADWAAAQSGLADAVEVPAGRTSDIAGLREAMALRRASLEATPQELGALRTLRLVNLVQTMSQLAERQADVVMLGDAASLMRRSLAEQPADPAKVHAALGLTLGRLGVVKLKPGETALLEESAAEFRVALGGMDRQADLRSWAVTSLNLAFVLRVWGSTASGAEQQDQAIGVYADVLSAVKRDQMPRLWARAQRGMGDIFRDRAERLAGEAARRSLIESVDHLKAAGEVLTRERGAAEWAPVQEGLALSLEALQETEPGTVRLAQAETIMEAVLASTNKQAEPGYWVNRMMNTSQIRTAIARRSLGEERAKTLLQAREGYAQALPVASATQPQLIPQIEKALREIDAEMKE